MKLRKVTKECAVDLAVQFPKIDFLAFGVHRDHSLACELIKNHIPNRPKNGRLNQTQYF